MVKKQIVPSLDEQIPTSDLSFLHFWVKMVFFSIFPL